MRAGRKSEDRVKRVRSDTFERRDLPLVTGKNQLENSCGRQAIQIGLHGSIDNLVSVEPSSA